MKILSTNLFFNFNKIPFSRIQNKNNQNLKKSYEGIQQLPQLDAITSRVYYKILNNNLVSFGQNSDDKKNKQNDAETFSQDLENAMREGKSINDFCREHKLAPPSFYLRVRKYGIDINKMKEIQQQAKEKKQKELDEKILNNHQEGGDIEKFCKENGIIPHFYFLHLKKMGIKTGKRQEEQKKLNNKILKNYQEKGNVKKFCEENGISIRSYYNHLQTLGINAQEERNEYQKTLNEQIQKNFEEGSDVEIFCQEHGIKPGTYNTHLKILNLKKPKQRQIFTKEQSEKLNEQILENYKKNGDIKEFCKEHGIRASVYYNRLRKLNTNIK